MKKSMRFAIVGCGHIAARHAKEMVKWGTLAAVADIKKEKADQFAQGYGANSYSDLEALLDFEKDLDLVAICTPNYLHAPQSISVLRKGIHVLCEKPMAIKLSDAHAMTEEATQSGKRLFVVKQNRYNPPIKFVRELLTQSKLGKIFTWQINCCWNRPDKYFTDWRGKKALDGGTLFTQFSHFVDLATWLFGSVEQMQAMAANHHHPSIEFEDGGHVQFRMKDGSLGGMHFSVNSYAKNMEGSITIIAEKGTIKIGGQYLNELEYFQVEGMDKPELSIGNGPNQYGFYEGSMSNHDKVYADVVRAIQDDSFVTLEAKEAINTVEIIENIYRTLS